MVTPNMRNVITFMIGCHYACYMRELDEIWSKKNFYCEKVYTSLTLCGSQKNFTSTNYLQYLSLYCNFNKDQFSVPFQFDGGYERSVFTLYLNITQI